ncbi:MAG: hypothetical protein P8Y24_11505 [Gammaproteobacteria bacterium]
MNSGLQELKDTVQKNCHISDALHAGNYTLCIYLMKMREFYRWEQKQTFQDSLPHEQVGSWLRQRENLWESLEDSEFEDITMGRQSFNPFEHQSINDILNVKGLVYSGGLGINNKPHFFLGKLESRQEHNGYTVLISSEEYARDLTSPPGMTQGNTIFIRRESLKRLLWEKLETWNWNQPDNAMGRALSFYDFKHDIENALEQMTEAETRAMLLHEVGEIKAGEYLGNAWEELLVNLPHSKAEIMLRAIRDHLADSLSTFPELLEQQNEASIHFYMGNLNNMRKHLYPGLQKAYEEWSGSNDFSILKQQNEIALQHWQSVCDKVLALDKNQEDLKSAIEDLIESHRL